MKLFDLNKLNKKLIGQRIVGPDFLNILLEFFSKDQIKIYFAAKLLNFSLSEIEKAYPQFSTEEIFKMVSEVVIFLNKNYGEDFFSNFVDKDNGKVEIDIPSSIPLKK